MKRRRALTRKGILAVAVLIIVIALVGVGLTFAIRGCSGKFNLNVGQDPSVTKYLKIVDETRTALKANTKDQVARLRFAEAIFHLGGVQESLAEIKKIEDAGASPEGIDALKKDITLYKSFWDKAGTSYAESLNSNDPASFYPDIMRACDQVIASYDAVLAQRAHFLKGHVLLREGRKDEARDEIGPLRGKYLLLDDYCQYYFARCNLTDGNKNIAMREFNKLIGNFPKSRIAPLGLLEQFNILRDDGKPDAAKAKAVELMETYPESKFVSTAHRKLAELYISDSDISSALMVYYTIIDTDPDSDEASKAISSLREIDPELLSFLPSERLRILEVMVDKGMNDLAYPLLDQLRVTSADEPDIEAGATYMIARVQFSKGEYSKSINSCQDAITISPSGPWAGEALNRIGNAYRRLGDFSNAIYTFEKVAASYPELAPDALYNAGDIHYSRGEYPLARGDFLRLAEKFQASEETESALKQLFIMDFMEGNYQACLIHTEKLIELFPDGTLAGTAHLWNAKAKMKLGKKIEGSEELVYITTRFQRTYPGIRALEMLGASRKDIERLILTSAADSGSGITGPGPERLETARELLRTNIFDLAMDEFAELPKGITPDAYLAEVKMDYMSGNWHAAYKKTRETFARGYGNLLPGGDLREMLYMGFPRDYQDEVKAASTRYGIDPSWLNGLILQESTFQASIVSHADAIGLLQIMPDTGRFIADLKGRSSFDPSSLYDIPTNLDYGAFYVDYLRKMFDNDLVFILAAYNGGPGNARAWKRRYYNGDIDLFIESIPASESKDFVKYVYTNIRIYQALAADGGN